MKTYYVYEHVRTDKNEVFYVGIGTKNPNGRYKCKKYSRAYIKSPTRRTNFWFNVFNKSGRKILINIVFESQDYKEIENKEIELIAFYGRKNLNKGSLVNLTDGGGGVANMKWSEEAKRRRSDLYKTKNPFKGKKHSQKTKDYLRLVNIGKFKGSKNPMYGKKHTEEAKEKLSELGKRRAARGDLPKFPTTKGAANHFAKKIEVIYHNTGTTYIVEGSIKEFCIDHGLSYGYSRKFRNKGKCFMIDEGRARKAAKNTVNWEFRDIYNK